MSNNLRELGGRGFDRNRNIGTGQQLQAAAVPGHETLQQGTVETMQVAERVGHAEQRLQVHVQRGVSQRSQVHQRRVAVGSVQSQSEIHRDRSGAAASFGVNYGKDLAAGPFPVYLPLSRGETDKRFQEGR